MRVHTPKVQRRMDAVNQCLLNGIFKVSDIMEQTKYRRKDVENSIHLLKDESKAWLHSVGINGFTHQTKLAIDRTTALLADAQTEYEACPVTSDLRIRHREHLIAINDKILEYHADGPTLMEIEAIVKDSQKVQEQLPDAKIPEVKSIPQTV